MSARSEPEAGPATRGPLGAGPIVFGYDGSDHAAGAISAASGLLGGAALVVHVWEPTPIGAVTAVAAPGLVGAGVPLVVEAQREIEQHAASILDEGLRLANENGFRAEPLLVQATGSGTWEELLEVAEAREASLVVVGRRGVSPLRGLLLGSVSNGLVRHSRLPVMVVPSGGSEDRSDAG